MTALNRSVLTKVLAVVSGRRAVLIAISAAALLVAAGPAAQAAITWNSQELTSGGNPAGSGTQWWFDPFNWSAQDPADDPPYFLPPTDDGTSFTDTQINTGTATLPGGEGVVYDPANDPHFAAAQSLAYPTNYGPQILHHLYISRNTTNQNTLTIKGDMTIRGNPIIGRSGSSAQDNGNLGRVVQLGGTVSIPQSNLDIGQRESSGWGNGVYDYRGGILDVSQSTVSIRLSHGGSSNGTGGHGRFIMHNPGDEAGGYVRTWNYVVSSDRNSGDGVLTGVGIAEFHFENGGVRPIQVLNNLSLNNGACNPGVQCSSRLELVLHEAPTVDELGRPQDLGLFAVNMFGAGAGSVQGTGDLRGDGSTSNDRVFSNADATRHFYPSSQWAAVKTAPNFVGMGFEDEDFLVTAVFGNTMYRWEASYSGTITWADQNNSIVDSITATGGQSVVLIGHSSIQLPPQGLVGDHNNDGVVDAADYVTWRMNPAAHDGSQGHADWRANFGDSSGSGASLALAAVPEPGALMLALLAVFAGALVRRRA